MKRTGQSLLEFAILLPLLLMLILGIADFGLAFSAELTVRHAVAEGSYVAAHNPNNASLVRFKIEQELRQLPEPPADAPTVVEVQNTDCSAANGPTTVIRVVYTHRYLFGFFSDSGRVALTNSNSVSQFGACLTRPTIP
jgi:hypothetical protein